MRKRFNWTPFHYASFQVACIQNIPLHFIYYESARHFMQRQLIYYILTAYQCWVQNWFAVLILQAVVVPPHQAVHLLYTLEVGKIAVTGSKQSANGSSSDSMLHPSLVGGYLHLDNSFSILVFTPSATVLPWHHPLLALQSLALSHMFSEILMSLTVIKSPLPVFIHWRTVLQQ